jgi:hypothetical protein
MSGYSSRAHVHPAARQSPWQGGHELPRK